MNDLLPALQVPAESSPAIQDTGVRETIAFSTRLPRPNTYLVSAYMAEGADAVLCVTVLVDSTPHGDFLCSMHYYLVGKGYER
jgi:hypothetical protein